MMDALLRDDRLRWDLAQLAATLDQLLPEGLGERMRFRGDEPLGLEGALAQIERLAALDRLSDELMDAGDPAPRGVDPDEMRDLLDEESAQDLQALQDLAGAWRRPATWTASATARADGSRDPAPRAARPGRAVRAAGA